MIRGLDEIKLIACDMDGTFLSPEHTIREENINAVQQVRKNQVEFIIATGRNRKSAQDIAGKRFSVSDNYGVFLNGALAYSHDGSLLFEKRVSNDLAVELFRLAESNSSISLNLCSHDEFLAPDLEEKYALHLHDKYDDPYPSKLKKGYKTVKFPALHMIHVLADPDVVDSIWTKVQALCKKHGATLARNLPTDIAITHPEATKGHAVSAICKLKNLQIERHVCAIGDSGNDVSMVSLARIGVAMGNAREELKRVANFVSSRNDEKKAEPGVARVLNLISGALKKKRKMVIYEVNIEVDADIAQKYVDWLVPHMKEMLTIPGFIDCNLADIEHLPAVVSTEKQEEEKKKKYMVATYRVESREKLQQYFDVHAARLRGDGVNRFKGRFTCTRRIHSNLK